MKTISPAKAAPVDLAAILRRTGYQIDQVDEEEQSNENVSLKEESSQSVPAEKPSLDITAPIPRNRMPAEPSEEVSIDEYMSHLLARSRGDSVPLPAPTASVSRTRSRAAGAAPRPAPAPVSPAPLPQSPKPGEPLAMAPRAVAPERQVDLKAMRQLANLSADMALHKHESKRLSDSTRAKLLVTIVAVVVGASLLVLHQLPGAPPELRSMARPRRSRWRCFGRELHVVDVTDGPRADGLHEPPSQGGRRAGGGGQERESVISIEPREATESPAIASLGVRTMAFLLISLSGAFAGLSYY